MKPEAAVPTGGESFQPPEKAAEQSFIARQEACWRQLRAERFVLNEFYGQYLVKRTRAIGRRVTRLVKARSLELVRGLMERGIKVQHFTIALPGDDLVQCWWMAMLQYEQQVINNA